MLRQVLAGLAFVLLSAGWARAHEVTIDTAAARAVLEAVANPGLVESEARRIAQMPANRMVLRKVQSFDKGGTEDRFVEELLAVASGREVSGTSLFRFERSKRERTGSLNTLTAIEQDPESFKRWISDRVEAFSPTGEPLKLRGHLVAAGGPTGFAFGGADFYLNITHFPDDLEAAKAVTAHELYHAVQGAAVEARGMRGKHGFRSADFAALPAVAERKRYLVDRYFHNLLTEGVAMYVGDPELLTNSKGGYSKWDLGRLRATQNRMDRLTIMLDAVLVALTAPQPIPYDEAYALGFYGDDQPLYYLGYEMAKAIAKKKGTRRLGELITGSGCGFASDYLEAAQGQQGAPKLKARTLEMIETYCRA